MTFARQQDGITFLCSGKCRRNGLSTIRNTQKIGPLTLTHRFGAIGNIAQDLYTIFVAGVLICNNEKITHLCSNASHYRTFLQVALSCRAKNSHQFASSERAENSQHLFQTIRGMGIVDNDCEWLSFIDTLHAACDACYFGQRGCNLGRLHSLTVCGSNGSQAIAYIETTYQLRFTTDFCVRKDSTKLCAIGAQLQINSPYCRGS